MSKKKRTLKFRMPSNKPMTFNAEDALRHVAQQYMKAEKELSPLIAAKKMHPGEAVVLIACYMHASVAGEQHGEHRMSEEDIVGASTLLVKLWEQGLFTPSAQFPYTLEQVQAAMQDDEDGCEDTL